MLKIKKYKNIQIDRLIKLFATENSNNNSGSVCES